MMLFILAIVHFFPRPQFCLLSYEISAIFPLFKYMIWLCINNIGYTLFPTCTDPSLCSYLLLQNNFLSLAKSVLGLKELIIWISREDI